MMIKDVNGTPQPYSVGKLRKDNPNTSFPKNIPEATLNAYDVYKVIDGVKPAYDPETQKIAQSGVELINGTWTRPWQVIELTAEEIAANAAKAQQQYEDAIQAHLDATAKERNYDSILTMVTYDIPTGGRFKAEAAIAANWRTSVWETAYDLLAEVQAGTRPVPTVEELIALLPIPNWPS